MMGPRTRFVLALTGLSVGVIGLVVVAAWVVALELDGGGRAALGMALSQRAALLILLAIGVVAVIAWALTVPFRTYVLPARRLADDARLIAGPNPAHRTRLPAAAARELTDAAAAVDALAQRLGNARAGVQAEVAQATGELDHERRRLTQVIAGLAIGVIVADEQGRVLLANARALDLLGGGDAPVGAARRIYETVPEALLAPALADAHHDPRHDAAAGTFLFHAPNGATLRARVTPLSAVGGDGGFVVQLQPAWPLGHIQGARLVERLVAAISAEWDVDVSTESTADGAVLRADAPALAAAVRALARRVRVAERPSSAGVGLWVHDGLARVEVSWSAATPESLLRDWERAPLAAVEDASPGEVAARHLGEVATSADEAARSAAVRFLLPVGVRDTRDSPPLRDVNADDLRFLRPADPSGPHGEERLDRLVCTVLDTETTGLDPSHGDEIISIAAVRVVAGQVVGWDRFHELVDPERPVPEASVRIHGIDAGMLKGRPTIAEVLPRFARFSRDSVLVGHNVGFDLRFLELKEQASGVRLAQPVLDTLLLAAVVQPSARDLSLEAVAGRLGIDVVGRHTALGDAMLTAQVFTRLTSLLAERGIHTVAEAQAASAQRAEAQLQY